MFVKLIVPNRVDWNDSRHFFATVAEAMRRKLTDAMQYPLFVLIAAIGVMLFFILFVLPQFSSVLQDFGNKSDSALSFFIRLSDFMRANGTALLVDGAVTRSI